MTPARAIGIAGMAAGVSSAIGIVDGISIIFTAPIGIACGIVAKRRGASVLGWVGIALNVLAPFTFVGLMARFGWFSPSD